MLAADHRLNVVAEDHLTVGIVFRGDHINGLVRVDGHKARAGQFLCQKRPDDLGAVHTQNGIHHGFVAINRSQRLRCQLGLALARFQGGHIHIIVDMGMAGDKMPLRNLQRHITVS